MIGSKIPSNTRAKSRLNSTEWPGRDRVSIWALSSLKVFSIPIHCSTEGWLQSKGSLDRIGQENRRRRVFFRLYTEYSRRGTSWYSWTDETNDRDGKRKWLLHFHNFLFDGIISRFIGRTSSWEILDQSHNSPDFFLILLGGDFCFWDWELSVVWIEWIIRYIRQIYNESHDFQSIFSHSTKK